MMVKVARTANKIQGDQNGDAPLGKRSRVLEPKGTNDEAERMGYDHFTRKGYSSHDLRTRKGGPLNESAMSRLRREVHESHNQKRKVGANRIKLIKE